MCLQAAWFPRRSVGTRLCRCRLAVMPRSFPSCAWERKSASSACRVGTEAGASTPGSQAQHGNQRNSGVFARFVAKQVIETCCDFKKNTDVPASRRLVGRAEARHRPPVVARRSIPPIYRRAPFRHRATPPRVPQTGSRIVQPTREPHKSPANSKVLCCESASGAVSCCRSSTCA